MQSFVPRPDELNLSNFCLKIFKKLQTSMLRAYVQEIGGNAQGSKNTLLTELKRIIHRRRCGQDTAQREQGEEFTLQHGTIFRVTSIWSKRAMKNVLDGEQMKKLAVDIGLDSLTKSVIYVSR